LEYKALHGFFKKLDRSAFLEGELKQYADVDGALPIGFGQTISQPGLVVEMTYFLSPEKDSKVLEIGTGSGYQTAFLAEFSGKVFTVERIKELAEKAKLRLEGMGYKNIQYKLGDGSEGWKENAPYDRIIVTAAAREIPAELLEQLKPSGRMVIPLGPGGAQELMLVTKDMEGKVYFTPIGSVVFVELKGKYGWTSEDK